MYVVSAFRRTSRAGELVDDGLLLELACEHGQGLYFIARSPVNMPAWF
jgi:hypothetical protein